MKSILPILLCCFACAPLFCACHTNGVSQESSEQELESELTLAHNAIAGYEEALEISQLASALIMNMAIADQHPDLFKFFEENSPESMGASIDDVFGRPNLKILSLRNSSKPKRLDPMRGMAAPATAQLLFNATTLNVIHFVCHEKGTPSVGRVDARSRWTFPDGRMLDYIVSPEGFELQKDKDAG